METATPPSKAMHVTLWIVQVIVSASLAYGGIMKLATPPEKLSAMWPWAGQVSRAFLMFTGIVDLAGALGLILPAMLRIRPVLTPVAATGVFLLMICASVFHISRGEAPVIGFNIFLAAAAVFIAWGRFKRAPVIAR